MLKVSRTLRAHLWGHHQRRRARATKAHPEAVNAKISALKKGACGYRHRFRHAILFHYGGLDHTLRPSPPTQRFLNRRLGSRGNSALDPLEIRAKLPAAEAQERPLRHLDGRYRTTAKTAQMNAKKKRPRSLRRAAARETAKAARAAARATDQDRKFVLFCDEAGNTGPNYLDVDQPLHVLAGWLVPRDKERALLDTLKRYRATSQAPELHAHRLWRRNRGKKILLGIIEACAKHCAPLYTVSYKRSCLALKLIDALMDPMTNPAAAWLPFQMNESRKSTAQLIGRHAPDELTKFGAVFKAMDVD